MKLYCKKGFHQFKKGDLLPDLPSNIGMTLVGKGFATATKPKAKKNVTDKK